MQYGNRFGVLDSGGQDVGGILASLEKMLAFATLSVRNPSSVSQSVISVPNPRPEVVGASIFLCGLLCPALSRDSCRSGYGGTETQSVPSESSTSGSKSCDKRRVQSMVQQTFTPSVRH